MDKQERPLQGKPEGQAGALDSEKLRPGATRANEELFQLQKSCWNDWIKLSKGKATLYLFPETLDTGFYLNKHFGYIPQLVWKKW